MNKSEILKRKTTAGRTSVFDSRNRLRAGFALLGFFSFQVTGSPPAFLDFIGLLAHGGLLPLYRIRFPVYFREYETGDRLVQYFFSATGVSHRLQRFGEEFRAGYPDGIFC